MERSEFQDLLVKEIEIAIMNILNDTEEDGMVAVGCTIGALTLVLSATMQAGINQFPSCRRSILDQTQDLFNKTIAIIEQPGETLQ